MSTDVVRQEQSNEITQDITSMAEYYYRNKPEIIRRLSLSIPKNLSIFKNREEIVFDRVVQKVSNYGYQKPPTDIYAYRRALSSEHRALFDEKVVDLLAENLNRELKLKKVPVEIFENGAMSYGLCDNVCYFGQYYLSMCHIRAQSLGLPTINWHECEMKYHIHQLDKIIEDMADLDQGLNNIKNIAALPFDAIFGNSNKQMGVLLWDTKKYPFAIAGARITNNGNYLDWILDRPSLKLRHDKEGKLEIVSSYKDRPVAIANIRAMKAFAQRFYLGKLDIYAGDDEDPMIVDIDPNSQEPEKTVFEEQKNDVKAVKESLAEERLRQLNGAQLI